eukprot:4420680-Pleurochrysis_carterae.AAC.1
MSVGNACPRRDMVARVLRNGLKPIHKVLIRTYLANSQLYARAIPNESNRYAMQMAVALRVVQLEHVPCACAQRQQCSSIRICACCRQLWKTPVRCKAPPRLWGYESRRV